MEFIKINDYQEYEDFVSNHPKSHFMQSYYWGEVMKHKNFIPSYVILKDNDEIIASALMLKKNLIKGYSYFYIPRGFILDYNNYELIEEFTKYLKEYARENKAIFIKIDPDIKLHSLDSDGNIISDENEFPLIKKLESLDYKHLGFYKGFEGEQPRFTFRLNLDREWEQIYGGMHPTTRKILNKQNQYNLNIYKGNIDDIEDFYQTMIETAEREGIIQKSLDYYKNFYSILNKQNMSDLYIVKVKLADLKESFGNVIKGIENEIDKLNSTDYKNIDKKNNLLKDLNSKLIKAKDEYDEINNIDKEEIILSENNKSKIPLTTIHILHSTASKVSLNFNILYIVVLVVVQQKRI